MSVPDHELEDDGSGWGLDDDEPVEFEEDDEECDLCERFNNLSKGVYR